MSKKPKRNTKTSRKIKLGATTLNLVVITLLVVSGLGYLIQVNSLVTKGYLIKDLEGKISQLEQESSELEIKSLELQSMDNVKGKISQLNLVEAGKVEYLQPTPVAVAR